VIIYLKSINQTTVVMETSCVFFVVRTGFLNIIWTGSEGVSKMTLKIDKIKLNSYLETATEREGSCFIQSAEILDVICG
jgi:hypothetical protein